MAASNKPSLDTLDEIFRFAVQRFRAARLAYGHGPTNARDEAAFLLLEALRLPIDRLDPYLDLRPSAAERARLLTLIDARVSLRLPAPYLVGAAYMHGVRFHADRRALIPRSFIGDMLADGVLPIGDAGRIKHVLDLCTGSGCLAILAALAFPRARIDAADLSAGALALARRNVASHRLGDRIALHRGDLFAPLQGKRYDLILSNPHDLLLRLHWIAVLYGNIKADLALTGGVHSATDVIKAMMAGARVAMMTSALLKKGINYLDTVVTEMLIWMDQHEYSSIHQMQGSMSRKSVSRAAAFERANYMKVLSSYTIG